MLNSMFTIETGSMEENNEIMHMLCSSCGVNPTKWDFFEPSLYKRIMCDGCREKAESQGGNKG